MGKSIVDESEMLNCVNRSILKREFLKKVKNFNLVFYTIINKNIKLVCVMTNPI
jgi:hypothetical protein